MRTVALKVVPPSVARHSRPRHNRNPLRDWLEQEDAPMSKRHFAHLLNVTPSYVSMLLADNPPWPNRTTVRLIGMVTCGAVTPNDLAGYPPGDNDN